MKNYLTIEGLFKGKVDDNGGVWMHKKFNPDTYEYEDCYTWFERQKVFDMDDLLSIKRKIHSKIFKEWRDNCREGSWDYWPNASNFIIKISVMGWFDNDGDGFRDEAYAELSWKSIESILSNDPRPDEVYFEIEPYYREGNPHDWGEWVPVDKESKTIVELIYDKS